MVLLFLLALSWASLSNDRIVPLKYCLLCECVCVCMCVCVHVCMYACVYVFWDEGGHIPTTCFTENNGKCLIYSTYATSNDVHTCSYLQVISSWARLASSIPYSMYYKPMDDLPYISSEQGGLIVHTELIYEYSKLLHVYLYKNFELRTGWACITSWAYNMYYTIVFLYPSVHMSIHHAREVT